MSYIDTIPLFYIPDMYVSKKLNHSNNHSQHNNEQKSSDAKQKGGLT